MTDSDTRPVTCPSCATEVQVPVEQLIKAVCRMTADGQLSLLSVPPALLNHLNSPECRRAPA